MSEKIPASSGRRQATGGRAGRGPTRGGGSRTNNSNSKQRTAPGMPGEARPYPGHPDEDRGGGFFFGKGGKP